MDNFLRMTMRMLASIVTLILAFSAGGIAAAQPAPDSLRLETVWNAAAAADPRAVQPELLERATRLRIQALRTALLPQISLQGEALVQNDVPELGAALPGAPVNFAIPKEQYRVEASAEWALVDGGRRRRQIAAERARLVEQRAGVDASLYPIREAATEAFFGVMLLDAQEETLSLAADALDAKLRVARVRVREGAALEAEAAVLEAELIRVRQQVREVAGDRHAAVQVLADLTGLEISPDTPLAVPDLAAATAEVSANAMASADRPDLERLDRQADRIRAEARAIAAGNRPTLSIFGRAGIGRPSPLDFLSDELQDYAVAGVRLRWSAIDWGRTRREAAAARVQADVLETEREALARRLNRGVQSDLEDVARLLATRDQDDRAVQLRELAAAVAGRQVDEGVLLPDAYATRVNDLAEARLTRERHRIELARARARVLSGRGRFPDSSTKPQIP